MISAQLRLLVDENRSVVGAVTEEGVESIDDEGEEACAEGTSFESCCSRWRQEKFDGLSLAHVKIAE